MGYSGGGYCRDNSNRDLLRLWGDMIYSVMPWHDDDGGDRRPTFLLDAFFGCAIVLSLLGLALAFILL